jgi:hypothetical protein
MSLSAAYQELLNNFAHEKKSFGHEACRFLASLRGFCGFMKQV